MMQRAQIERVSKALADETRLIIFEAIASRGEMNCSEIVSLRGVTPATVSHHLKVLADAQLIECRRQGQFVYSNPVPGTMEEYTRSLTNIIQSLRRRKAAATSHRKDGRQPDQRILLSQRRKGSKSAR